VVTNLVVGLVRRTATQYFYRVAVCDEGSRDVSEELAGRSGIRGEELVYQEDAHRRRTLKNEVGISNFDELI
jgi:hypothetical protein